MENLDKEALKPIYKRTDFLENKIRTFEIIVDAMCLDYSTKEEWARKVSWTVNKMMTLWSQVFVNSIVFPDGTDLPMEFLYDLDDLHKKLIKIIEKETPVEEVEGIIA